MVIKCEECDREFQGNKLSPDKIFICRFCMGEGFDPKKFQTGREKAIKILTEILGTEITLLRKDIDKILVMVKNARDSLI